jgi:hypothetical protein
VALGVNAVVVTYPVFGFVETTRELIVIDVIFPWGFKLFGFEIDNTKGDCMKGGNLDPFAEFLVGKLVLKLVPREAAKGRC